MFPAGNSSGSVFITPPGPARVSIASLALGEGGSKHVFRSFPALNEQVTAR